MRPSLATFLVLAAVAVPLHSASGTEDRPEAFAVSWPVSALSLRTEAEPRQVTVGDRIRLIVVATHPPGMATIPPAIAGALGAFEVLDRSSSSAVLAGAVEEVFTYTLTTFDVGISTIPPLSFGYRTAENVSGRLSTSEVPVFVKSVLDPQATNIRDIKPPRPAPGAWRLWIALALLAASALLTAKKMLAGKKTVGPQANIVISAYARALAELAALEEKLVDPPKIFYTAFSDAMRRYVEGRFGVPALDRTTAELFAETRRRALDTGFCLRLRELLEISDLAKFAKADRPAEERRRDLETARELILSTVLQTVAAGLP